MAWDHYKGPSPGRAVGRLGQRARKEHYYTQMGRGRHEDPGDVRTLGYPHPDGGDVYPAMERRADGWFCFRSARIKSGLIVE